MSRALEFSHIVQRETEIKRRESSCTGGRSFGWEAVWPCCSVPPAQPLRGLRTGPTLGCWSVLYHTSADHVSGSLTSAGVTGGVRILPWLDVEIDVLQSIGQLSRDYTGPSISFAGSGAPASEFVVTRFVNEREGGNTVSVGAVFHPRVAWRRISPRLLAGISSHRTKDRTVYEHVSLPPGVTLEQVNRAMPPEDSAHAQLRGALGRRQRRYRRHRSTGDRPRIRYDYGSIGDEINIALRSSIRRALALRTL